MSHQSRLPRLGHRLGLLALASLCLCSGAAMASGYRFGTQSAAAEGTANANGAEGDDASTLYANPAAITRLSGLQFSGVADYLNPKVQFTDAGSYISLPGSGFQPRPIANVGDTTSATTPVWVPHLYAAYKASDTLAYGLGIFVPSGAQLDYGNNWGGRYNIQKVDLKSLAFNPNIAWKPSKELSIAGGVSLEYMSGDLRRAVPYGSVYAAALLGGAQQAAAGGAPSYAQQLQQLAAQVFGDPSYDGSVHVSGSDWGLGMNLAVLWELDDKTRLGASWRSGVRHKLEGHAEWTQPSTLPAQVIAGITGSPYDGVTKLDHNASGANLSIHTPDQLSLQGFHQLTERWAVMADATWYQQSRLQELRINFENTTAPSITPENWKDAWRLSLGTQYRTSDTVLLRAGVAWDRSPVDDQWRGPALPDADRTWFAVGANLRLSKQATLDLAYGYIKVKDAPMSLTDDANGQTPCNCSFATVRGNYKSSATSLGLQFNYLY